MQKNGIVQPRPDSSWGGHPTEGYVTGADAAIGRVARGGIENIITLTFRYDLNAERLNCLFVNSLIV